MMGSKCTIVMCLLLYMVYLYLFQLIVDSSKILMLQLQEINSQTKTTTRQPFKATNVIGKSTLKGTTKTELKKTTSSLTKSTTKSKTTTAKSKTTVKSTLRTTSTINPWPGVLNISVHKVSLGPLQLLDITNAPGNFEPRFDLEEPFTDIPPIFKNNTVTKIPEPEKATFLIYPWSKNNWMNNYWNNYYFYRPAYYYKKYLGFKNYYRYL